MPSEAPAPAIDPATLLPPSPVFLVPGAIVRVSTDAAGAEADADSTDPALSGTARFVAFQSRADNLVPGDANGAEDVFVKNLRTGAITLASTDADGAQSPARSLYPSISATGRYVAFDRLPSFAQPPGPDARTDVFVKDLRTGSLQRASAAADGTPGDADSYGAPSLSANGRRVAFSSQAANLLPGDTNDTADVFVKNLRTGGIALASADAAGVPGNSFSEQPSLSADGLHVAFSSRATNLLPGDDTHGVEQVFVKNLRTGAVAAASADAAGALGDDASLNASISADGRFVAFSSAASNLLPGDTNGAADVFVKDMQTGAVVLASADAAGNGALGFSGAPALSPDGRFVAFESTAPNLVPGAGGGHADVFLRDLWTGGISLVAANPPPPGRTGISFTRSAVSDTGAVAFASRAGDLVPGDARGVFDVFLSG